MKTTFASGNQSRSSRSLVNRIFAIAVVLMAIVGSLVVPSTVGAQGTGGMDSTFYGYFSDDMSSAIMLGEMNFDSYITSEMMVSPAVTETFFDTFDLFSGHKITRTLKPNEIAAVGDADEYLVYEGDLDFVDGEKPGYVMFLSTNDRMFIIVGYVSDRKDLFGLAGETIDAGSSPMFFNDYTRIELN